MKPRYPRTAEGWLAYLLRAGVSEENSAALASWCEERPENRTEFELLSQSWHHAGELSSNLELVEARSPWPRRLLVAAGLACILVGVQWFLRDQNRASRYETARGEQRTVSLADGSRILLNTATTVDLDADQDRANLLAGEAFFDVNPRKASSPRLQPFSVDAGVATIQVLGTQFNVLREGEYLLISVLEGRVRVDSRVGPGKEGSSREVRAGEIAEIHGNDPLLRIRADSSDLDRVQAWRQGKIELDRTPLRRALRELSRYTPLPLEIGAPHLEELPVSGIFRIDRLGNLDSVRFALENSLPVRVRSLKGALELIPSQ